MNNQPEVLTPYDDPHITPGEIAEYLEQLRVAPTLSANEPAR